MAVPLVVSGLEIHPFKTVGWTTDGARSPVTVVDPGRFPVVSSDPSDRGDR